MKKENTVGYHVWAYLKRVGVGHEYSGFHLENADPRHPLSGLRIMRRLRKRGLIDYEIVGPRKKSRYRLNSISKTYY